MDIKVSTYLQSKEWAYLKVFTVRSQSIAIDQTDDEVDGAVKLQSVARVGGNGEWGIHGIIGKEVMGGRVYYCVDWEPTMMPIDELLGAERLVREFEAKEEARLRRAGNTREKKHRGRPRKQK